ncbi:hypothetical protein [Paenibacillus sp. NEAU-GSW1]|uniref:hypothetical protein n=1 Tax=Paenibacillus sp. NEAU-GSW1 TaxID=2682486 RepID=UPI0012E0F689|nr:hypothetical protein [Paenibacillus sp. NEAU-GSW1]MUT66903.1 hypothetical protein [Paenibacillus sp. NEAU-GSW1]
MTAAPLFRDPIGSHTYAADSGDLFHWQAGSRTAFCLISRSCSPTIKRIICYKERASRPSLTMTIGTLFLAAFIR